MAIALDRPICVATLTEDDTVDVSVDGVSSTHPTMAEALHELGSLAADLSRPVKVTAIDPSSPAEPEYLIVHPDGSVDQDSTARQKSRTRKASRPARPEREPVSRRAVISEVPGSGGDDSDQSVVVAPAGPEQEPPTEPPSTESTPSPGPVTDRDPVVVDRGDNVVRMPAQAAVARPTTPARMGWRGWLNAHAGASFGPGAAEAAARDRRSRIQRHLDGHRTVAVIQLKGGGSKTTTTFHVAATYGRVRGGNILAGEFNENQGTLAERSLSGAHERTTLDLIRNLDTVTRRTSDLVRYVRPQGDDRIHVLASPPEGTDRSRVDGRSVTAAHATLSSLYSLILLDTGNSAQSSTWQAAVNVADSLILVAHNREDDARLLEATVAAVRAEGHGDKLSRSLLVIANTATANKERLARFRQYAETIGLAGVNVIPFDRSLQEGAAFNYDILSPATVQAWEDATADLTDQL